MGEKSKPAGWNLAWGKSTVGKLQCCDFCQKEAQKLQYVADKKKWCCVGCAGRPMLAKGKMFDKLRMVGKKEYDKQNKFVQETKFES